MVDKKTKEMEIKNLAIAVENLTFSVEQIQAALTGEFKHTLADSLERIMLKMYEEKKK